MVPGRRLPLLPPPPLMWLAMNGHHYGHCSYTAGSACCWSEAADQKEWICIDEVPLKGNNQVKLSHSGRTCSVFGD